MHQATEHLLHVYEMICALWYQTTTLMKMTLYHGVFQDF